MAGETGTYLVPLTITIPVASLAFLPDQEGKSLGRVRLLMFSTDEDEKASALFDRRFDLRVADGTSPRHRVSLTLNNKMRHGNHRLAVGIIDDRTMTASYLVYPVVVGSP